MADKYTLTLTNLSKAEAMKLVENKYGLVMWDRVDNVMFAYPTQKVKIEIKKTNK
jgi:hypothetical protein